MKTLFVLLSHPVTLSQFEDAKKSLGVDVIQHLKYTVWSAFPANEANIEPHLAIIKEKLQQVVKKDDILWVQGDFGAVFSMVSFVKSLGVEAVYATTERKSRDIIQDNVIMTIKEFKHVRFRYYK